MRQVLQLVLLASATLVALAVSGYAADVKGSHDSPLVSRYAGSSIIGYQHSSYGELNLPLGKADYSAGFARKRHVEGELTRIIYVDPPHRSPLEVFANFRNALTKAGFNILFNCELDACGRAFHQKIYPMSQQLHQSQQSEFAFGTVQDQHYLTAEHDGPHGTDYVALYVVRDINDAGVYKGPSRTMTLLQVIRGKLMQGNMVTVDAAAMARDIAQKGHVAIYGVLFDTDKAVIKPASRPALEQMAKMLRAQPKLQVYIVGHTDNVGTLGYNMTLSDRRARAVVRALTTQYAIAPQRLVPRGVGPLAPVASNATPGGRAKNRRVELVAQ